MIVSVPNSFVPILEKIRKFCVKIVDIFDVVRDTKDRVYLMDFSPFGERWSESLAFEWEQLLNDFNITDVRELIAFGLIDNLLFIYPAG